MVDCRREYLEFIERHRPELIALLRRHKDRSCREYFGSLFDPNTLGVSDELIECVQLEVERVHGEEIGSLISDSLSKSNTIATGEHAAFFGDPIQFQSALGLCLSAPDNIGAVLSLAFGNVPLDNTSTGSGVIHWNNRRYRLISNNLKERRQLIYGRAGFDYETLKNRLGSDFDGLANLFFPADLFASSGHALSDQFAAVNLRLWRSLFPKRSDAALYVQIPAEELVNRLVINSLLSGTAFHKMLAVPEVREFYLEHFSGIRCCHTLPTTGRPVAGTSFFWARSLQTGRQFRYFPNQTTEVLEPFDVKEGRLVSVDADDIEPITLNARGIVRIIELIQEKRLVPSVYLAMCALVLHGAVPSGGYHQIKYLSDVKNGMLDLARKLPNTPIVASPKIAADVWQRILTDQFCLGPLYSWRGSPAPQPITLSDVWNAPKVMEKIRHHLEFTNIEDASILGATVFGRSFSSDEYGHLPSKAHVVTEIAELDL